MRVSVLFATGVLTTLMASSAALAADYSMLRGTQQDAPQSMGRVVADEGIDWNGLTIAAHGGLSRTYFDFDNSMQTLATTPFRQTLLQSEINPSSWIKTRSGQDRGQSFGAILGYNLMIDDIVVGLEADYTRIGQKHSSSDFIGRRVSTSNGDVNDVTLASTQAVEINDYATARVRLGLAKGRFMPFVTFGGAAGRFNSNQTVVSNWNFQRAGFGPFQTAVGFPATSSDNRKNIYGYGLTGGVGVDVALTSNVFLRAEYQYVRFADVKGTTVDVNTIRAAGGVKF